MDTVLTVKLMALKVESNVNSDLPDTYSNFPLTSFNV